MMPTVSKEAATKIAAQHVRRQKYTEKVDVAAVEKDGVSWIVRGTCPLDVGGHPWAEKFEVVVDPKGKVKSAYFSLL